MIERFLPGRDPQDVRQRVAGMVLAIALEVGLLLILLTLGMTAARHQPRQVAMVSFDADSHPDQPPAPPERKAPPEKAKAAQLQKPSPVPPVPQPDAAPAAQQMPALIPLNPQQMASADISQLVPAKPKAVIKGPMGPPNSGSPSDSQRVAGSGPHGEPLYAASWYREPYPDELSGYLSTASGPGWALINCQTVPDFRVDHCVLNAEFPGGSGIGRAVLAAAWQFRVRPPRVGGQSMVGDWVRIKITYELKRQPG